MKIKVGKRVVGEVKGEIFYKRVDGARHFLKIPPAIAFDVQSIADAEAAGARFVEITDIATGTVYRATTDVIHRKGFSLNRGFGEQIALVMDYWNKDKVRKEVVKEVKKKVESKQVTMF